MGLYLEQLHTSLFSNSSGYSEALHMNTHESPREVQGKCKLLAMYL